MMSDAKIGEIDRLLVVVDMQPLQGKRFQPTGYPDLGAAEYQANDGKSIVLLESPQSVANHLERHCLSDDGTQFVKELAGLSMVTVMDGEKQVTNSVREGHRLASPYILGMKKPTSICKEFESLDLPKESIGDRLKIVKTIFKYDACSLLHGLWLSRIGAGRIRVPRAMSGFIEAEDCNPAISGGVKKDHVVGTTKDRKDGDGDAGDASSGVGSIPFTRIEYTAKNICAYFNVDVAQIRSYGLGPDQTKLLVTLALWKIRKFIDAPFRPRTACDLRVVGNARTEPDGCVIPSMDELDSEIGRLVNACKSDMKVTQVDLTQK